MSADDTVSSSGSASPQGAAATGGGSGVDAGAAAHDAHAAAFRAASALMPGGVNSPVRAFKAVEGTPVFAARGQGPYVFDITGKRYIDYIASYGPLILGHAHPAVVDAVTRAAAGGTSFGMPTEAETHLAQMIIDAVPSVQVVRMVNSGTEAVLSAIRLVRAATGRNKLIKFTGCYHGHADALLLEAGSGAATLGVPSSPGVPQDVVKQTLLLPFNDADAVERALAQHNDVAAVLVEPIAGNMGCVPPEPGFLDRLRKLCSDHGVLLVFDEVMTGFRVDYGGAQTLYTVLPDITCMGKVVGGGLPCAAYGGREDLMRMIAPDGPVYQAGTLSGNPLAMAAGRATLGELQDGSVHANLELASAQLAAGLVDAAGRHRVPVQVQRVGSMITVFFADEPVKRFDHARACNTDRFARFFHGMLKRGVMLPPSQFETWFVGAAHDQDVIEQTIAAADKAFAEVASAGLSA